MPSTSRAGHDEPAEAFVFADGPEQIPLGQYKAGDPAQGGETPDQGQLLQPAKLCLLPQGPPRAISHGFWNEV